MRDFLLGEEDAKLQKSPIVATVTMARLPKEAAIACQKIHPRYNVGFHPQGIFTWISGKHEKKQIGCFPNTDCDMIVHDAFADTKPGDWTFMLIQSWIPKEGYDPASLKGPAILADWKERATLFAEPFRSIFESVPEGTQCWHNQLSYWIPQPWDNRNSTVTLIGDAAHPMTFHRGQGLNNAIHDVADLAKFLSEKGTNVPKDGGESAIDLYEREIIHRGRDAVISSNENSLATHDWSTLLQSPLFKSGLNRHEASKRAETNGTDVKT